MEDERKDPYRQMELSVQKPSDGNKLHVQGQREGPRGWSKMRKERDRKGTEEARPGGHGGKSGFDSQWLTHRRLLSGGSDEI